MIASNGLAESSIEQVAVIDEYVSAVSQALEKLSRRQISDAVDALYECRKHQACTYIVGNGGSAATASHMMNDLVRGTWVPGARPFQAIALTDNVPLMTAISNDLHYDRIFSDLLEALLQPHDVLVAISASGNSANVLKAVRVAKERGAVVIGMCGNQPSGLSALADVVIAVPAELVGQQEDGHMVVNHALARALRRRLELEGKTAS